MTTYKFETEDKEEFATAMNAASYKSALWEFHNFLRAMKKYEDHTPDGQAMLDRISEAYFDITEDVELW